MDQHFNHQYSGGKSVGIGDRYYAQDLGRDFWYLVERTGQKGFYQAGKTNSILYGGDVVQGSSITQVDVPETYGFVGFDVTVPNSFASLPPTTQTESIKVPLLVSAITNQDISTAVQDGVTVNYLKAKYKETDDKSRARAKAAGTYFYEVIDDIEIVLNQSSAAADELLLCSFVTDGATTLTITQPSSNMKIESTGNINFNSGGLYVDTVNNRIGIGNDDQKAQLHVGDPASTLTSPYAVGVVLVSGTSPVFAINDTDGSVDNKLWDCVAANEQLRYRVLEDSSVAATNYMTIDRTGTTVDNVNFPNGNVIIGHSGSGSVTGLHVGDVATGLSGASGTILMSTNLPILQWYETDGSANNRLWGMFANGEQFAFHATNDLQTFGSTIFSVDRTSTTVDNVNFPNGVVNIGSITGTQGKLNIAGDLSLYDGSTDVDRHAYFASDAHILWDESDDRFRPNKELELTCVLRASGGSESLGQLRLKIIEIGDWDMDTNFTVSVAHGLGADYANIRSVWVTIRNDADNSRVPLYRVISGQSVVQGGINDITSTNIVLGRYTGGSFDSTSFDSTSYNRGWIYVLYEA